MAPHCPAAAAKRNQRTVSVSGRVLVFIRLVIVHQVNGRHVILHSVTLVGVIHEEAGTHARMLRI